MLPLRECPYCEDRDARLALTFPTYIKPRFRQTAYYRPGLEYLSEGLRTMVRIPPHYTCTRCNNTWRA